MKNKQKEHNIKSNIVDSTEDTMMSFDPKSLGKLLNSLTRIYPNEHLAVIREYAANGCDAHAAAGQTRPIELTLPTPRNPNFITQDWGTGMTYREIDSTYGVYGKSTKEETDEEFGFFGLGSKSALNICDSFRLISIKDGEKSVVLIYRGQDRIGRLRKISVTRTDEPNGTTVIIPTDRFDDFREAAERIFPTWKKNSVLIDGQEPKYIDDNPKYDKVGELGYIETNEKGIIFGEPKANIKVILGGITYRVGDLSKTQMATVFGTSDDISKELKAQEILVRFDNLSDLPILPSREEIAINEDSLAEVGTKVQAMLNVYLQQVKDKVNNTPNAMDAVQMAKKYKFAIPPAKQTWQGHSIPDSVDVAGMEYWSYDKRSGHKTKMSKYSSRINVTTTFKLLVVDTEGTSISNGTILKHLKVWANHKYVTLGEVALLSNPTQKFTDIFVKSMVESGNIRIVKALDIIEYSRGRQKLNRNSTPRSASPRSMVKYPCYVRNNNKIELHEYTTDDMVALGKKVFYFQHKKYVSGLASVTLHTSHIAGDIAAKLPRAFAHLGDDSLLVFVSAERKANPLVTRLTGKVSVADGLETLNDIIFTAAINNKTSVTDRVVGSIKRHGSFTKYALFDRDDVESKVMREVGRRIAAKESGSTIATLVSDGNLLLGLRESRFNEVLSERGDEVGEDIKDVIGNTVLEAFYQHYPLLGPIIAGIAYNSKALEDTKFVNHVVEYVNMVTRRDGEFTIS